MFFAAFPVLRIRSNALSHTTSLVEGPRFLCEPCVDPTKKTVRSRPFHQGFLGLRSDLLDTFLRLAIPNLPDSSFKSLKRILEYRARPVKRKVASSTSVSGGMSFDHRKSCSCDRRAKTGSFMRMKLTKGLVVYATKSSGIALAAMTMELQTLPNVARKGKHNRPAAPSHGG